MNFLAHLYLSGDDPDIIIGNFIADHVKGRKMDRYRAGIQDGIRLHRAIDTYTDTHLVVKDTLEHLRPGFRKYAGVALDMFFDHFLASGWPAWSAEPLEVFTVRMYRVLMGSFVILPARTRTMLPFMMQHNWLLHYREIEGLNHALNGMARRTVFRSNLENAAGELQDNYGFYRERFNLFFPDLKQYAFNYLQKLKADGAGQVSGTG